MEVTKCPCDAMIQAQKDLKDHNERLHSGDTRFEVMQVQLNTIAADTKEIKADLKEIKEKPAKRWDSLMEKVISWAVLGYLAWVVSQLAGKL